MRVDVDAHAFRGLCGAERRAGEQTRGGNRTRPQHFAARETASACHVGIAS